MVILIISPHYPNEDHVELDFPAYLVCWRQAQSGRYDIMISAASTANFNCGLLSDDAFV
jgi:hypothetical protein